MASNPKRELLRRIPSLTELLKTPAAERWTQTHPRSLVADCLRRAVAATRERALAGSAGPGTAAEVATEVVLAQAATLLQAAVRPRLRHAINATGVILHTGLGRAVFPAGVVDSMLAELKGCTTLAVDRQTGDRVERDELVEYILTELTGAEAATVVNNNAAATMLVLAALASQKEVIVSRGHLIEIGGSFRLPDVMAQSGARLVEVGTTNRTHLRDYERAITAETAAILRVHPSNYRVVGFTSEVPLPDLVKLAHSRNLPLLDDLGAGALVGLEQFGLPHEPTMAESIKAGADLVLASGDKLMGASQAGIIVGTKDLIARLRKHPLMRALRVDKTCLLVLERTLHLFRKPESLRQEHPTYRMLATPPSVLRTRAKALVEAVSKAAPKAALNVEAGVAYLGSGSLPTEAIPSVVVSVSLPGLEASELARRLRLDDACIFSRIQDDLVRLDMRTITDDQVPAIAAALARVAPPAGLT